MFLAVSLHLKLMALWLTALSLSCAKDRSADAYHGRAFFNGHFKVVAHAHGEFLHGDLWQAQSINSFCQLTQLPEVRAHLFRVSPPGRQGHQALDAEVRQRS